MSQFVPDLPHPNLSLAYATPPMLKIAELPTSAGLYTIPPWGISLPNLGSLESGTLSKARSKPTDLLLLEIVEGRK